VNLSKQNTVTEGIKASIVCNNQGNQTVFLITSNKNMNVQRKYESRH